MSVATSNYEKFLDLVEGKISSEEEQYAVIRELLETAGYEITTLEKGTVHGREIVDVDESRSFVANPFSGIKALGLDNNSEPACYLEMIWRRTAGLLKHPGRDEALKYLEGEITEHIGPFKPVVVSSYGEEIRATFSQNFAHKGEETKLACSGSIAHSICSYRVELKQISSTHNALVCSGCGMRIVIPAEVETVGQLRTHFSSYFAAMENF